MMNQPSEEDKAVARSQALLSLGLGMMANSTGPRGANGLGQIVGRAGLGSMDDYQRSLMMAQQRKQQEFNSGLQLQKLKRDQFNLPAGMQFGEDGKPTWIPGYLEGQERMKQQAQQPYYQFLPTANGYAIGDARRGTITMPDKPLMRASDDPALQGQIAGSKEGAKVRAESQATSEIQLPSYLSQANETLKQIDELRKHPGYGMAVGKTSMLGMQKIPGTDAYGFVNRLNQLKGGAFLQAFNSLKGGGAITEVEGKKATEAIARMDNATSEEDFSAALNDYESVIRTGMERAQQKATQGAGPVSYPSNAGLPGVKVPVGNEGRQQILMGELQQEQQRLAQAQATGDLRGISEANRNIQLLQKEMGSKPSQPAKVRRYNPQTGRIE